MVSFVNATCRYMKCIDYTASYKIRKNSLVIIKFDESVTKRNYTDVVNLLRSSPEVDGVQAEQGGVEVCPLP